MRLAALRKRSNDELYSREEVDASKHKGYSEYFRKTGWPDMSQRAHKPEATANDEMEQHVGARWHPHPDPLRFDAAHCKPEGEGVKRSHSEAAAEPLNPLQEAANAVVMPKVDIAPDERKPLEVERKRAA